VEEAAAEAKCPEAVVLLVVVQEELSVVEVLESVPEAARPLAVVPESQLQHRLQRLTQHGL